MHCPMIRMVTLVVTLLLVGHLDPAVALQKKHHNKVTIVFIPGIFESTLKDSDGNVFWGENGIGKQGLSLTEYPNLEPELFSNVKFSVWGLGSTYKGYANIDHSARHLSNGYSVFAYDWRKSNKQSAATLNKFLCHQFTNQNDRRRIVFVAHSMGGLVLRHWIKDFLAVEIGTESCLKARDIETFLFAATPHIGSLEPVQTLFTGTTALEANAVYSTLFTGGMGKYGVTFESSYELLPAHNIAGLDCDATEQEMLNKLAKDIGTGKNIPLYLNEVENWKLLEIPRQAPPGMGKDELAKLIAIRVRTASSAACELLKFSMPLQIVKKMNFVVGALKNADETRVARTTLDRMVINSQPGSKASFSSEMGMGDGTVPAWSSEPRAIGIQHVADYPQTSNRAHDEVLDDVDIITHLQRVVERAATKAAWLSGDPVDIVVDDKASWSRARQAFLDLQVDSMEPELLAAGLEFLGKRADVAGVTGLELYRDAKVLSEQSRHEEAAIDFALASRIRTGLNDQSLLWAHQNTAYHMRRIGNNSLAMLAAVEAGVLNSRLYRLAQESNNTQVLKTVESVEVKWRGVVTSPEVKEYNPEVTKYVAQVPEFDLQGDVPLWARAFPEADFGVLGFEKKM